MSHESGGPDYRLAGVTRIGVDGGGSGCRAVLRTPSGATVFAQGGPANVTSDAPGSVAAVVQVLQDVLLAAQIPAFSPGQSPRLRAHLGLAGVLDAAQARDVVAAVAQHLPSLHCSVSDDRTVQAIGALGGQDGFVAAVGTGSTVARVQDGTLRGVGGWGFVLGDDASGAWLGRQALSRVLLVEDGLAPPSGLTRDLLHLYGGANGIVRFARTASPKDFATLAPQIVAAATAEDPLAVALLTKGAAYLDRALGALGFAPGDRLCLTGGLGPRYANWVQAVPSAAGFAPVGDALSGALVLADREAP